MKATFPSATTYTIPALPIPPADNSTPTDGVDGRNGIAGFLAGLRNNAERWIPLEKWYRILSEALRHFLKGRQLLPLPLNLG